MIGFIFGVSHLSHPLVVVHGSQWTEFLTHLKETIAFLARNDGIDKDETRLLISQYVKEIEDNKDNIFLASAYGIVTYLNFYNVRPTEGVHDEFKGIYFTGMAVSEHLHKLGLAELNKLHLRAMLRVLDFRLAMPHKARRDLLTERIRSIIDNGTIEAHLGKYGWYITYKCLFNAANEKSKTI